MGGVRTRKRSVRTPLSPCLVNRELRKRLDENIVRDCGHWIWVGGLSSDQRPAIRRQPGRGRAVSARRVVWEEYRGPVNVRLRRLCDEALCLAPDHMRPWVGCEEHGEPACRQCMRARQSRPWVCDCGLTLWRQHRKRHLQICAGPTAQRAPQMPDHAVTDALEDWKKGITPDRILRAYSTTPQALMRALYRRPDLDSSSFRSALQRVR